MVAFAAPDRAYYPSARAYPDHPPGTKRFAGFQLWGGGTNMLSGVRRLGVAVVGVGLAVSACSSSGGGGVSQSQLESKLKNEPSLKTLVSQGGAKGKVANQLVDCIAKAIKKDADQSDLKKYVDGKLNINDLGGKSKGAGNNAAAVAKSCAQHAVQSDKSSSPAS